MNSLLLISVVLIGALLLVITVSWTIHLEMSSEASGTEGWASYRTFKRHFQSYNWKNNSYFPESLECNNPRCSIHASILEFDGKVMKITDPINWVLVSLYVRVQARRIYKASKSYVNFKRDVPRLPERGKVEGYDVRMPDGSVIHVSMEEIYGTTES